MLKNNYNPDISDDDYISEKQIFQGSNKTILTVESIHVVKGIDKNIKKKIEEGKVYLNDISPVKNAEIEEAFLKSLCDNIPQNNVYINDDKDSKELNIKIEENYSCFNIDTSKILKENSNEETFENILKNDIGDNKDELNYFKNSSIIKNASISGIYNKCILNNLPDTLEKETVDYIKKKEKKLQKKRLNANLEALRLQYIPINNDKFASIPREIKENILALFACIIIKHIDSFDDIEIQSHLEDLSKGFLKQLSDLLLIDPLAYQCIIKPLEQRKIIRDITGDKKIYQLYEKPFVDNLLSKINDLQPNIDFQFKKVVEELNNEMDFWQNDHIEDPNEEMSEGRDFIKGDNLQDIEQKYEDTKRDVKNDPFLNKNFIPKEKNETYNFEEINNYFSLSKEENNQNINTSEYFNKEDDTDEKKNSLTFNTISLNSSYIEDDHMCNNEKKVISKSNNNKNDDVNEDENSLNEKYNENNNDISKNYENEEETKENDESDSNKSSNKIIKNKNVNENGINLCEKNLSLNLNEDKEKECTKIINEKCTSEYIDENSMIKSEIKKNNKEKDTIDCESFYDESDIEKHLNHGVPMKSPEVKSVLLRDLITTYIMTGNNNARIQLYFQRFAKCLKINELLILRIEENLAADLISALQASTNETSKKKKIRRIKIAFAALGGGALIAFTAGLAAPGIIAGLTALGAGGSSLTAFLASASGLAFIVSLFGAGGAGLTGYKYSRRIANIKTFEFIMLNGNISKSLSVCVCVSGEIQSDDDITQPWLDVFPNCYCDLYCLKWENHLLKTLGSLIETMLSQEFAITASKIWLQYTIASTLSAALTWPLALIKYASNLDNVYLLIRERAQQAGRILADALSDKNTVGQRPVILIGYSVGARVIFYCLKYLYAKKLYNIVSNAIFIGLPATTSVRVWEKIRMVVTNRVINVYSKNDWLLGFLYRYMEWKINVAGLISVKVPNVENYDASGIIHSHLDYKRKLKDIFNLINFDM
ncbi:conserved protein, unknown function [Plasmodium gallinaceum]|uniref:DUF726-domain-containing protein n=1 Tax=Plasmodium gallinaceum TaxID=5849 RepID=A0A1J1GTW1_PLAGA|nr:conserved protein, unknown function [Plasmodium gallinaceum]CRG95948.1 conserved protein, unknown function [Plasmodium gallinaceum]